MWKYVSHHEFYIGIFILISSTIWMTVFFGNYNWFLVLPLGISWVGITCLFDFFERKYFARSVIPNTLFRRRKMFLIVIVALVFCMLLEGFGVFIGRLWYYPFFPFRIYFTIAPFAFAAYTLLLYVLYEFARDVVARYRKINFANSVKKQSYVAIMNSEVIFGIIGYYFAVSLALKFLNNPSLSSFIITQKGDVPSTGLYLLGIVFVSTFFIFEFICFKQNKQTLTHDILSGNWWPIIFIIMASIIAIVLVEFLNGPFQIWRFSNWPYDNIRILNVPIMAILTWPAQFPVFLSMLRAIFPSREVIW